MKKIAIALLGATLIMSASYAGHSWSNYHWARTTSSFGLTIVNSTTSDWDGYVSQAVADKTKPSCALIPMAPATSLT